ncbi:Uncharacterised protein [Legionella donaldsonii]|uniref:Uncharacterized protein n=1 Tax=Legionella donaldsonii TaxID=45060 RepID=A0A378JAZ2_9GAMM|nr:Uncharacterised protein [Legionella donaldsonii]
MEKSQRLIKAGGKPTVPRLQGEHYDNTMLGKGSNRQ